VSSDFSSQAVMYRSCLNILLNSPDLKLTRLLKSSMMVINFLCKKRSSFIGIHYISPKFVTLTTHMLQGQSEREKLFLNDRKPNESS
jgi:hypothetical protein